jgi:hypothetical protein
MTLLTWMIVAGFGAGLICGSVVRLTKGRG